MNILLNTFGDPIWQVLALVITLAAPVLIMAVRTRNVHASEHEKRRDTLTILLCKNISFFLSHGRVATNSLLEKEINSKSIK